MPTSRQLQAAKASKSKELIIIIVSAQEDQRRKAMITKRQLAQSYIPYHYSVRVRSIEPPLVSVDSAKNSFLEVVQSNGPPYPSATCAVPTPLVYLALLTVQCSFCGCMQPVHVLCNQYMSCATSQAHLSQQ